MMPILLLPRMNLRFRPSINSKVGGVIGSYSVQLEAARVTPTFLSKAETNQNQDTLCLVCRTPVTTSPNRVGGETRCPPPQATRSCYTA